jgi:DNA repair exonuclease SbcCD ATPase subunit
MSTGEDIKLICRQCGQEFIFTQSEQEFYEQQGFVQPRRCPQCRAARQNQTMAAAQPQPQPEAKPANCRQCGAELDSDASVYCSTCFSQAHGDLEQENARIKKASNEAHSKLMASDAQRAQLAESLRQQEQVVLDLQEQIAELNRDLEKAYEFHNVVATLQPALTSIEDRLRSVEYTQNKINDRMLQLAERVHEMYENTSLLDVLKRGMGQYGRQQGTHY